jgi:hypothetical protein
MENGRGLCVELDFIFINSWHSYICSFLVWVGCLLAGHNNWPRHHSLRRRHFKCHSNRKKKFTMSWETWSVAQSLYMWQFVVNKQTSLWVSLVASHSLPSHAVWHVECLASKLGASRFRGETLKRASALFFWRDNFYSPTKQQPIACGDHYCGVGGCVMQPNTSNSLVRDKSCDVSTSTRLDFNSSRSKMAGNQKHGCTGHHLKQ